MKNLKLEISIDNQPFSIEWSDPETFWTLTTLQKRLSDKVSVERFFTRSINFLLEHNIFKKDPDATVLDIGSGIGTVDLFLQQYTGSTFHLLDKDLNENLEEYEFYSKDYKFYNDRKCTVDAIETTKLDFNKFALLDPESELITYDVITSYGSWCWHYPLEVYWNKVKNNLKSNGKLYLDISTYAMANNPNLIKIISEWYNCEPVISRYTRDHRTSDPDLLWKDGSYGFNAIWTNLRDN